jgi:hypothetical protein
MNISAPFIRRPIATSLLMLGVLVFGVGADQLLPVASLPTVNAPGPTKMLAAHARIGRHIATIDDATHKQCKDWAIRPL